MRGCGERSLIRACGDVERGLARPVYVCAASEGNQSNKLLGDPSYFKLTFGALTPRHPASHLGVVEGRVVAGVGGMMLRVEFTGLPCTAALHCAVDTNYTSRRHVTAHVTTPGYLLLFI